MRQLGIRKGTSPDVYALLAIGSMLNECQHCLRRPFAENLLVERRKGSGKRKRISGDKTILGLVPVCAYVPRRAGRLLGGKHASEHAPLYLRFCPFIHCFCISPSMKYVMPIVIPTTSYLSHAEGACRALRRVPFNPDTCILDGPNAHPITAALSGIIEHRKQLYMYRLSKQSV